MRKMKEYSFREILSYKMTPKATWIMYAVLSVFGSLSICLGELLYPLGQQGNVVMVILFCLLYMGALLYFTLDKRFSSPKYLVLIAVVLASGLLLRYFCLDYRSGDYNSFLKGWVEHFRVNGGFMGIKYAVGDYNVPYLYLLAFISYFKTADLYLIKFVSIVFDVLMMIYAVKIISLLDKRAWTSIIAICALTFAPTIWLNGSQWGQCDSIFTAFILMAIYYAFVDRPVISVAMLALSFAFKMQVIFFLPAVLVFLYVKKYKIRHLFVFPVAYVVTILPAVFLGKPFVETLTIYMNQVGTYSDRLTLNAPSMYAIIGGGYSKELFYLGIVLAGIFLAVGAILLYKNRELLSRKAFIHIALICCIGVVYFLPSMHERYFYVADVLSIIFACLYPKRFYVPIIVILSSFEGYYAYLKGGHILTLPIASALLFVLLCVLIVFLIRDLNNEKFVRHSKRLDGNIILKS